MVVERLLARRRIEQSFRVHPAVALLGARQCGKSTLARMIAQDEPVVEFFDLERAVDQRRLAAPEAALAPLDGLVVIDEIQRQPALFETLRVLVDQPEAGARFLLLGSSSPALTRTASETLAGRVGRVDLPGFDLAETSRTYPAASWRRLWQRGGFPRSYLAVDDAASALWRENFVGTFLERDVPQLGIAIPAEALRRFWTMIAHYHGRVWNAAEFAQAIGSSRATARRYLDILSGAYMVRVLPPWFENVKKRQVKSPKVYVRDTGLLHTLLELDSAQALAGHPKVGASFESFAIEQIVALCGLRSAYFWATHGGAELDLMVTVDGRRYGFEFKLSDAPGTTRSMRAALRDLSLAHLWVVYPGDEEYALDEGITALPIARLVQLAARWRGTSVADSADSQAAPLGA